MGTSFKLEENYGSSKNKKNKKSFNLFYVFIFMVVVVIFVIVYFVFNSFSNFVEKKALDKDYIYTVKKVENSFNEGTYDEVPAINLVGGDYSDINNSILNNYLDVSRQPDYDYGYEYSISKNILSLKITYAYYPTDTAIYPIRYFETINIDLKSGEILSDDALLDKYGLTEERVDLFLEAKFKGFYSDLVNYNYYTEKECNYECFLKNRGISDNYLNGVSYYVDDGSLIALKYFYTYSFYEEEQYFENEDYQFIVKE